MKMLALSAVLLGVMAGSASAATAYMKPASFYTPDPTVAIDASFTTQFFTPTIGLDSPNFKVVLPNGQTGPFATTSVTASDSNLTASLPDGGTYRVTTGDLMGPITHYVADASGHWAPLAEGATAPPGAQTMSRQSVSLAEAYVTRGAPSRGAVDASVGTLSIHPITHPNQILTSTGFEVQLLMNGQPFANQAIVLYAAGDPESNTAHFFATGADGHAMVTFDHAGVYVLAARYIGDAPAGSGVDKRSYTTTLTFEVTDTLPAVTQIAAAQQPQQQPARRRTFHSTRELFH